MDATVVSDFMVNSRMKLLNGISMEFIMRMQRKKDSFCTSWRGRTVLITTGDNFPDTKYEFYGFSDDLGGTIN